MPNLDVLEHRIFRGWSLSPVKATQPDTYHIDYKHQRDVSGCTKYENVSTYVSKELQRISVSIGTWSDSTAKQAKHMAPASLNSHPPQKQSPDLT
jgi:hypothetical protein